VWAFVTWVLYAAYLHARLTGGWRGRRAAVVLLGAFSTFVFNYLGVKPVHHRFALLRRHLKLN
jgi:ABC-type transport system involved in cytochrome c biogenesis permease subunit